MLDGWTVICVKDFLPSRLILFWIFIVYLSRYFQPQFERHDFAKDQTGFREPHFFPLHQGVKAISATVVE